MKVGIGFIYKLSNIANNIVIFTQNKNFLKINDKITAKEFSAIMADHYETLENSYNPNDRSLVSNMNIENDDFIDNNRRKSS